LLHYYDPGRTVVYILHGDHDYYYDLAVRHQPVIDVFVTYSRTIDVRLRQLLPNRQDSIFYLPYGIAIPAKVRTAVPGKLRLIFAGRLEHGQKGIFDLPLIDRQLREQHLAVEWTIVGGGPDEAELRSRWQTTSWVRMCGVKSQAETIELFAGHDVFVLPTRAEGFPVALLEAMGAGLVPVISNLTSGVPEVVVPGVNGYRPEIGDVNGFADAIAALDRNRELLETLSQQARQTVIARFDIRERVGDYQQLFARWRELRQPKPQRGPVPYGSRLDKPWLPNALVYAVRASQRRLTGRALP
jgi:glycosyltransferase involved in cell wall biosynthesis